MTKTGPQLERFEKPLSRLRALFSVERVAPGAVDATIDEAYRTDARGDMFAVEGLLRLYRGIYDEPIEALLASIKAAEDTFGHAGEKVEWLDHAKKVGAPPRALEIMQRAADEGRAGLRALAAQLPERLDRLSAALRKIPWQREEKDARRVLRELAGALEKCEPLDYDPTDLQGGIHEMRRDLRWFLINLRALDGLVVLEPPSSMPLRLNCYSYLATHPIASGRFSRLDPNPKLGWVSSVPTTYFLALGKIVAELGDVKSFAENAEALARALHAAGEAPSPAAARERAIELTAGAGLRVVPDVPKAAARIMDELRDTRLLRRLRRHVRDGLRAAPGKR